MKNLIKLLAVLVVVMLLLPTSLFAQNGNVATIFNPAEWFITLAAFVGVVMTITEFLKVYIFKTSGFASRFLSWIVSILLALLGWILQAGIFAGLPWYWIFLYGLSAGFIGNGIFDIGIIKAILSIIPKKDEE